MSFKIGNLGNFDLVVEGTFLEQSEKGATRKTPFKHTVKRVDVPTALDIMEKCPLTFGRLDGKKLELLGDDGQVELRKQEHLLMLTKIESYFPEEFRPKLKSIPYLTFIGMVNYMITGDESSGDIPAKLAELLKKISDMQEKILKKKKKA